VLALPARCSAAELQLTVKALRAAPGAAGGGIRLLHMSGLAALEEQVDREAINN
jgi:hypothetical protein